MPGGAWHIPSKLTYLSACGLLLGDAMNVPPTQQDLARGDLHDPAIGEQGLNRIPGSAIRRIVKPRHHDPAVGDVEVDLGRRHAPAGRALLGVAAALAMQPGVFRLGDRLNPGRGDLVNLEFPSARIRRRAEPREGIP